MAEHYKNLAGDTDPGGKQEGKRLPVYSSRAAGRTGFGWQH
jgi:hypothetical protein